MDNRENATYKYIILAVAFMVTVVVTFISMNYETSAISTMTMTHASGRYDADRRRPVV